MGVTMAGVWTTGRIMLGTVLVLAVLASHTSAAKPPNIVFVVADDLGWNDVGWHNPKMLTPNLDKFAREGVILNSSYVQYFCSPSRNAFMSGYFPYHTGLQHYVIIDGEPEYLPLNFTTLPQLLKKAGYATHMVGKWHLGMCNWKLTPTYRGFDSYFGYYSGKEDYYTHMESTQDEVGYDLRLNTSVYNDPENRHFSYMFTEQAVRVIEDHDVARPIYLYLPMHLVHCPRQVPIQYEALYPNVEDKDRKTYCGMVSMMDEAFGNITRALESKGLLDNTLLVFTTDNGGPIDCSANNWPLRGAKTTFWEGGTRGAAFAWSKDLFKKTAYINNGMMHAVDWYPTILQLAGLKPVSNVDGVDQWEMLSKGGDSNRFEFVYNIDTFINSTAIRYKDYKLLTGSPGDFNDWYPEPKGEDKTQYPGNSYNNEYLMYMEHHNTDSAKWKPQLYNIKDDPEERNELSESQPEMLKFMLDRLKAWMATGVPPQNKQLDPKGDPKNWGGVWTPGWCEV